MAIQSGTHLGPYEIISGMLNNYNNVEKFSTFSVKFTQVAACALAASPALP